MNLEELKTKLNEFKDSQIIITSHAHKRIQDKRRKINYGVIFRLIKTQEGLYKFEEQNAKNFGESKYKLWFKLNYFYDMNVYLVIASYENKDLNRIEIISAHKVKREIQKEIEKWKQK